MSEESIEKMIETRKRNGGWKDSAETTIKRRNGQLNRIINENFGKIMSEATKGIPKSEQHKRALQEATKRQENNKFRNKQIRITCPHCGVEGGELTMPRWHFDNCRNKKS